MASGDERPRPVEQPDEVLLRRLRGGDASAFDELFRRHYDRVYGILFRLVGTRAEAEDVAQEVFLRLYRQPPARATNLSGWLYRVATNAGYNALRTANRRRSRELASISGGDASAVAVEDAVLGEEEQRRVRAALARLPERAVQLLLLRQVGLSYREVAEVVGVAPGSVGTLLSRASAAFRQAYADEMEKEG